MMMVMIMMKVVVICEGYESRRHLVELPTQRELSLSKPLLRVIIIILMTTIIIIRMIMFMVLSSW